MKYPSVTLRTAVDLSDKHIHDRALPDKAIDVIDEVGAWFRVHKPMSEHRPKVKISDVERVVAKMANIPPRHINTDEMKTLRTLEECMKSTVFAQDEAIEKIVAAIKLSRSGLRESTKPIGSFLFAGPTGVGKTEVAKQLALLNGMELQRFDMSEYMERHTVSRLIGAPPGYVGYDHGGLLTDCILKNPHAVVLFDEIEKAHPDVFNLLLQVMDYGTLTDSNGRKVDFSNTIIILTTNVGSFEMSRSGIGFTAVEKDVADGMVLIKQTFSPEFRNRLDAIIPFNPLAAAAILSIVDKFLMQFQVQMEAKKIQLQANPAMRKWLADKGFNQKMGARPLQYLINEKMKKPILDEILFGKLKHGGKVSFDVKNDKPVFTITAQAKKRKAAKTK